MNKPSSHVQVTEAFLDQFKKIHAQFPEAASAIHTILQELNRNHIAFFSKYTPTLLEEDDQKQVWWTKHDRYRMVFERENGMTTC